jgi:hypothetical protein
MATVTVPLQPYNTVTLVAGSVYHLTAPSPGHYYINILNSGTGNIAISKASTVGTADPNSYTLPPNLSYTAFAYGPDGIWIAAAAGGGSASVALVPRQGGN